MKNLSELTLTELYYLSNGNTIMDIDAMVPELKAMSDEDRKNTIGRLIYCMSSGVGGSPIIEMFKTKLNEALTEAAPSSTMSLKRTVETPETTETPETPSNDDTTSDDTVDVDDEVVSTAEIVQDGPDDTDK